MAVYTNTFEFGVAGNAEQKLEKLIELLDKIKQSSSGGSDAIGNTIKESAEKGEAAVKKLNEQLDKVPKDKEVNVKTNANQAKETMFPLMEMMNKLPKTKTTKVDVDATRGKATMSELMSKYGQLPKDKVLKLDVNAGQSHATMSGMIRDLYKIPKEKKTKLDADTTEGISAVDKFNARLKNTDSAAEKTHSLLKTVFAANIISNGVTTGIAAIGSGIHGMISDLNEASATWQTFDGNLSNLGKSAGEIKSVREELQSFAQKTIYSASDMASTYSQLAAVGTKNTTQLVEGFGGLAAAAENPTQAMKTLSQQATQAAAKPKIQWQDFKLMLEQTPAGISAVAKTMGESTTQLIKDVQDGKVKTQDFFDAIAKTGTNKNFSDMATKFKTVGQAMDGLKESLTAKLQPAFDQFSKVGIGAISSVGNALMGIDFTGFASGALSILKNLGSALSSVFGVGKDAFEMFKASYDLNVDKPLTASDISGALKNLKKMFEDVATAVSPLAQTVGALAGALSAGVFNNIKSVFSGLADSLSRIDGQGATRTFADMADKLAPLTGKISDFMKAIEPASKAVGEMAGEIAKQVWTDFGVTLGIVGKGAKTIAEFIGDVVKGVMSIFGVKSSKDGVGVLVDVAESLSKNQIAIKTVAAAITAMLVAKAASNGLSLFTTLIDGLLSKTIAIGGLKGALGKLFSVSGSKGFASSIGKLKAVPGILKEIAVKPIKLGAKWVGDGAVKLAKTALSGIKSLGGGSAAKGLGKIAIPIAIAFDVISDVKDLTKAFTTGSMKDKFKSVGESAGTLIGGGIGFAFGGPAGAAIGATIGKVAGKWAGSASKEFTDGWNKKGKGVKPPSGLLPKAGYYTRAAGDGAVKFSKSLISGAKKHAPEILTSMVSPLAGVATWIAKDTKTGRAVSKWAKGFSSSVKKIGLAKTVQKEISNAGKTFSKTKFGKWFDGISKSYSSWKKGFGKAWSKYWSGVGRNVKKGLASAQKNVSSFGSGVSKWWGSFTKSFGKNWSKYWSNVHKDTKKGLNTAQKAATSFGKSINKWWNSFSKDFSKTWSRHWDQMGDIFGDAFNAISKTFSSWISKTFKVLDNFGSDFSDAWTNISKTTKSIFSGLWDEMKKLAGAGINIIVDIINGGIGGINSVVHLFGGKSETITPMSKVKYATGTGSMQSSSFRRAINEITPAIVNDEPGASNPELIFRKATGNVEYMPTQNASTLLFPGDEVANASDSAMLAPMLGITHFAGGGIGDFFGGLWDGAKGFVSGAASKLKELFGAAKKIVESPSKALDGLMPLKKNNAKGFFPTMVKGGFNMAKKQAGKWWDALWSMVDLNGDGSGSYGGGWASPGSGWTHTDGFGSPRGGGTHDGNDFSATVGTAFHAMHGGTVKSVGPAPSGWGPVGYNIVTEDSTGKQIIYQEFGNASDVKVHAGQHVKTGDVLGKLGRSGLGTGPHLHVGLTKSGSVWDRSGMSTAGWLDITKQHGKDKGSDAESDSDSKSAKADSALQKIVKSQVGSGFWKTISKLASMFGEPAEGDAGGGVGDPSGSGVQRWKSTVKRALKANGLSTSSAMVNKVLRQIAIESGGNSQAVQGNIGDANNASGDLAKGLMQVIGQTFNAYKFSGHGDRMNGYDNLLAALNYAKTRYGSNLDGLGEGRGYAEGGHILTPEIALVGEDGDEFIVNAKKPNAFNLAMAALKDVMAKQPSVVRQAFKPKPSGSVGGSPLTDVADTNQGADNSLLNRIDQLIDNTQKLIDKGQDIYMDNEKVTKHVSSQGAKDINLISAQLG
jgi:tape measure domain-containing protein